WYAGNGTRRDSAFGKLVALVAAVHAHRGTGTIAVVSMVIEGKDDFAAIDDRVEVESALFDAKSALGKKQIAKHQPRALKAIHNIEHLRNQLEAVSDVQRRSNNTRIIAKSRTQHLPKIALLSLGGNSRGRSRALAIDDHDRSFDHGRHAQALAHQREP